MLGASAHHQAKAEDTQVKSVIDFLADLSQRAAYLADTAGKGLGERYYWFYKDYASWSESCLQVMRFSGLTDHASRLTRLLHDPDGEGSYTWKLGNASGILDSAKECLERGFVGEVKYLLHA